jgi:hypothetical protein
VANAVGSDLVYSSYRHDTQSSSPGLPELELLAAVSTQACTHQ